LQQALANYRTSLAECPRATEPLEWARTQASLGVALLRVADRGNDTRPLLQAITCFQEALSELTRERAPLDWANVQNSLGGALERLAEHDGDSVKFERAIDTYHAPLLERSRERAPREWATTQNNLGNALRGLAVYGGPEHPAEAYRILREAAKCHRAALAERTRQDVPMHWAASQHSLGMTLRQLAEHPASGCNSQVPRRLLRSAIDAFQAASSEFTRERVPSMWAKVQYNLWDAVATLAVRGKSATCLAEALDHMRDAAAAYRDAGDVHWLQIIEQRIGRWEVIGAEIRRWLDRTAIDAKIWS